MSETDDQSIEPSEHALIDVINEDMRQLVHHIRCTKAPDDVLEKAIAAIQAARDELSPYVETEEGWSTISVGAASSGLPWREDDITSIMPYSPVSGKRNPVSPPLKLWRDGNDVRGEAIFPPTYAGPPDSVHGGIIAAVFDEVLAMANVISGTAGFTGTLTIRYHATTPLNTPIELYGINVRRDGRKQVCKGEMRVGGKLTASAEGLFICAAETLGDVPAAAQD
ncbi:MAG: PaaI family thioesterase [Halioglobus sp.]